jgi:hypothetical protein
MEQHIAELRDVYLKHLPADQLPLPEEEATAPMRKAA